MTGLPRLVLCGECHCVVPASHWFGHVEWHAAVIRFGLISAGFKPEVCDQRARAQAATITFDANWGWPQ